MLIGIIADTHDNMIALRKAVDYFKVGALGSGEPLGINNSPPWLLRCLKHPLLAGLLLVKEGAGVVCSEARICYMLYSSPLDGTWVL